MGTLLAANAPDFDQCFDALNLSQPDWVLEVHRAYLAAGADLIQSNTFGANPIKLAQYGLEGRVAEINAAGVRLARQAAQAAGGKALVAGDVGPSGARLAPFGRLQPEEARAAFAVQIGAQAEAGADLILIETFSDLFEVAEAVAAARQVCDLPVVASVTFTRDDLTILGDGPAVVARALAATGADGIGVNCSSGPAQVWRILRAMRQALDSAALARVFFSVMPNAGWPEQVGGRVMYPSNPDYFGEYALAFCEAGARLVGGCCGTTPAHIGAMRRALDSQSEGCAPTVAELTLPAEVEEAQVAAEAPSPLAEKLAAGRFVVAVEMDPPRGLSAHKLLAGASLLAEAGADVINVADSPMARMRMSPWAVCALVQRQLGVDTVLHFPTRGRNLLRLQGDLLAAHALGIHNIFVVMGDPTAIGDYPNATDAYDLVPSGLLKLIKRDFNAGMDHAGSDIGQPTQFFAGCALNLDPPDVGREIKNLRRKLAAGADFILTQPVFEPDRAAAFLAQWEASEGPLTTPLLVGILPLYGVRHAAFLHNEVPGITIPAELQQRLRQAGADAPQEGVRIALELAAELRAFAQGIYLMPAFGRYDLSAAVVEGIKAASG
jgi:homocysteine S-methyltransferase